MRTISPSIVLSTRGRPGLRRSREPSNLRATSLRYQARMVSGRAAFATSPSALRPSRRPISPSFARSASESFSRPFNWPPQNPVFSSQILIPQQQLMVHRPRNVGQDTCPLHESPLVCPPIREGALNRPKKPSGRHAARLRRDGITARLSCSFNFLATRDSGRNCQVREHLSLPEIKSGRIDGANLRGVGQTVDATE